MAIILASESLQDLEKKASNHLHSAINGWLEFCKVALQIKASNMWKTVCKTWKEYVRKTWQLDDSRIRQHKMLMPYAEKIKELVPDITANEADMGKLRKVIHADNPLMPSVHTLGVSVANDLGSAPSESIYRHCLAALEENEATNGYPTLGGNHVSSAIEGTLELIVTEHILEAKNRNIARLKPRDKITLTTQIVCDNRGQVFVGLIIPHIDLDEIGTSYTLYKNDKDES